MDRQYTGNYDGYLGYDFLKKHKAIIDVHKRTLILHAPEELTEIPTTTQTENEIPIKMRNIHADKPDTQNKMAIFTADQITMEKCRTNGHECGECANNEWNLSAAWNNQKLRQVTIAAIRPALKTDQLASIKFLNAESNLIINDYDDESTKLHKITTNKLRLPPQASDFLKAFPPEPGESTTKSVFSISCQQGITREQVILSNLPTEHCSASEIEKIHALVHQFPLQFYVEGDKLARTNIIQHRIHLKPNAPILHTRQFRLSETMRKDVINETKDLQRQGIITPSISPYNSPAFMVPKKDDGGGNTDQRFVVSYVKVNEHTQMRDFPIPRIEQLVDNFSGCKIFSTLDIKSAFHQIEMCPEHREITAFTAGFKKYQWECMPFGLCGAPLTMQEAVTTLLGDLLDKGVSVYIDDVSIGAPDIETHDRLLYQVFERLERHNFQVKIKKCHFYVGQFEFLGFIIYPNCLKPNPNKVTAILKIAEPKTRKALQHFLGMVNYYRKFIPNLSRIAKPLTTMTSIKFIYEFDDECRNAFNQIKEILANDVTLKIPNFNERFYISCDASNTAIAAVLAQGKPPDDRPIQFFSKTLQPNQQKWIAMERECLALTTAVKEFAPYLQGREFTLITDNLALVYINGHNDAYSKLFRMKMDLTAYKYTIVYRPGAQNRVADALTRLESEEELPLDKFLVKYSENLDVKKVRAITRSGVNTSDEPTDKLNPKPFVNCQPGLAQNDDEYDRVFSIITAENQKLIQKLTADEEFDETLGLVKLTDHHYLATISTPNCQKKIENLVSEIFKQCAENPEITSVAINTDFQAKKLFVLKFLLEQFLANTNIHITLHTDQIIQLTDARQIENALEMHHKTRLGGHCGIQRMLKTMKRVYSWPTMIKDIKEYVSTCAICEKSKIGRHTNAPLLITSVGDKAFDHVYIDYMGPVVASNEGHTYIFVAICDLTKYSIAAPTMGHSAPITADCFVREIILKYGFPSMITSDRGAEFLSELFTELNKRLNIKQISTTPYHPSSNIVERQNRNLNQYLRAYVKEKPQYWATLLPYATFAYNITVHSSTGFSPFHLLYGREVTLPDAITKRRHIYNYDNYVDILTRELHDAWTLAQENLLAVKIKNKQNHDIKVHNPELKIGDFVYISNEVKKHKWDDPNLGPFPITDIPSDQYIIIDKNGTPKKIHRNRTKKSAVHNRQIPPIINQLINVIRIVHW